MPDKKKGKNMAALVIEMVKKKDKPEADTEDSYDDADKVAVAEEILTYIGNGDPEGLAMALKDFIYICQGSDKED